MDIQTDHVMSSKIYYENKYSAKPSRLAKLLYYLGARVTFISQMSFIKFNN